MIKEIFVNLPVKDLAKSKEFFSKLGFSFNKKFEDDNATCMIIGKDMYAMLLVEKFFKGFLKEKEISDSSKTSEVITALAVNSRQEVDEFMKKVLEAGGKRANDPYDLGFMYGCAFEDLDRHIWEVFYMDESKFPSK